MNVCTQQCLSVQRESVLQARNTGPASLPPSHPPGGTETNSQVLPFGEMFPFQIKARLKRLGCAPVLFPEPVGRFQPGREARGGGCWGRAGDRDVPAGEDWQEFIGKGGRGGSSVEQGGADSPLSGQATSVLFREDAKRLGFPGLSRVHKGTAN